MSEERVDAHDGVNTRRDPVLVLPPGMKAPGKVKNREGEGVRVVGQKVVPADRSLIAKIESVPPHGRQRRVPHVQGQGRQERVRRARR